MQTTSLSPDQKRLLAKMREINYGSIKNFEVHNGILILPRCLETTKQMFHDCRHRNKPAWDDETHASMPEIVDLFSQFMVERNIKIHRLSFEGGLPTELDYVLPDEDPKELFDSMFGGNV